MLHAQKKQKQNSKSSVFQIQNQSIFSSNQNQNKFWPRSNRCKQMVFLPHNLEYLTGWHPQKMFRGSFSWLELSSSSTTFTQTRLPTLFGCTVGRRKRLLTKKTSKEDGILVVGLDSSDSSGSTLTNSAKLLLLCPAAACLLRLLLLSDVTQ